LACAIRFPSSAAAGRRRQLRRRGPAARVPDAALWYFLALVIDGALAGAIHALIALAFVLVYIRQA
jgi:hypothetical protein